MAIRLQDGSRHVDDTLCAEIAQASADVEAARARLRTAEGPWEYVCADELRAAETRQSVLLALARGETYEGRKTARQIYEERYGDGGDVA